MGEHKLNGAARMPSDEEQAALQRSTEAQQQAAQQAHVMEISKIPSHHAQIFSAIVLPNGYIRVTYGDQLDPRTPPAFHGSFTTGIDGLKGFHGLLGQMITRHDEVTKSIEAQRMQQQPPPSVDELEKMLREGNSKVEILPDGTVRHN